MQFSPAPELTSHANRVRMTISDLLGQDMPNSHQELAGDGDNRFAGALACGQPFELGLPIGMMPHGDPGGFNEGRAQFTSSLFGDGPCLEGLSRGMHADPQPTVADQLLG